MEHHQPTVPPEGSRLDEHPANDAMVSVETRAAQRETWPRIDNQRFLASVDYCLQGKLNTGTDLQRVLMEAGVERLFSPEDIQWRMRVLCYQKHPLKIGGFKEFAEKGSASLTLPMESTIAIREILQGLRRKRPVRQSVKRKRFEVFDHSGDDSAHSEYIDEDPPSPKPLRRKPTTIKPSKTASAEEALKHDGPATVHVKRVTEKPRRNAPCRPTNVIDLLDEVDSTSDCSSHLPTAPKPKPAPISPTAWPQNWEDVQARFRQTLLEKDSQIRMLEKELYRTQEEQQVDERRWKSLLDQKETQYQDIFLEKDRKVDMINRMYHGLIDKNILQLRPMSDFPPTYDGDDVYQKFYLAWRMGKASLLDVQDTKDAIKIPDTPKDKLTQALLSRLCCTTPGPSGMVSKADIFQGINDRSSDQALFRGMFVVNVFNWTFDIFRVYPKSYILDEMYETVEELGGLQNVRMHDLVYTQKRLRENRFKNEYVPHEVKRFVEQMVHSVRPYLEVNVTKEMEGWITSLATLRAELSIGKRPYKVFFIPPGTQYDPDRMIAEDDAGMRIQIKQPHEIRVRLCVWPGLVAHDDEEDLHQRRGDFRQALVESRKFFAEKHSQFKGWPGEYVISRAIVLVEEVTK